jgi:hypothetical protein
MYEWKREAARRQRQVRRQPGPVKKLKRLASGRFRVTDDVDYFRMADGPDVCRSGRNAERHSFGATSEGGML